MDNRSTWNLRNTFSKV